MSTDTDQKCKRGAVFLTAGLEASSLRGEEPQESSDSVVDVTVNHARQAQCREKSSEAQAGSRLWPAANGKRAGEQRNSKEIQLDNGNKALKGITPRTLGLKNGTPGPGGGSR